MLKYTLILLSVTVLFCACGGSPTAIIDDTPEISKPDSIIPFKRPDVISRPELSDFPNTVLPIDISIPLTSPFGSFQFNKVVAYDFNKSRRPVRTMYDMETGAYSNDISKQVALNTTQTEQLIKLLSDVGTYGAQTFSCFDPRLGIIFYEDDQPTMVVNVCLDCNYLNSSVEIPAMYETTVKLDESLSYPLKGFSKKGQEGIVALCKELGLYYGEIKPEQLPDFEE